jgi:hypothetical protein
MHDQVFQQQKNAQLKCNFIIHNFENKYLVRELLGLPVPFQTGLRYTRT